MEGSSRESKIKSHQMESFFQEKNGRGGGLVVLQAVEIHRTANLPLLTLACGAGGALQAPRVLAEATHAAGVQARLLEVRGQAGVGGQAGVWGQAWLVHAAQAALTLGHLRELAGEDGTEQRLAL